MSPAVFLRSLTPLGWLAAALVIVSLALLVLGGLGFRWDPFDLDRRRAERAEASAVLAQRTAAARTAEAEAQAGQVARLDGTLNTLRRTDAATTRSIVDAQEAPDADQSLTPDRRDRLRAHDRELCRLALDLGGCAAALDLAGNGRPTL